MNTIERVPFRRFVLAFALLGENFGQITVRMRQYGYNASEDCMQEILDSITLPPRLKEKVESNVPLSVKDDKVWLEQLGVHSFCDFIMNRKKNIGRPYFKWFEDCLWILSGQDTAGLVNIFLFNNEPLDSISNIILFKYKKKISTSALRLYQNIFWDTASLSAKDVLISVKWMKTNTLIVKRIATADMQEGALGEEQTDGSNLSPVFQDSDYVKWKIGYGEVKIPKPNDFLDSVMKDSYFKYQEAMGMTQSAETQEEAGTNEKLGQFGVTTIKRRNVEEHRIKNMKAWFDLYLKASNNKKAEGDSDDDFFKNMRELSIDFGDEKLAEVDDEMMNDIKDDL